VDEPSRRDVDVDARFLLANERTVLAWLRTSVALLAAGAAVHEFGERIDGNSAIGFVLILLGGAAGLVGGRRYRQADVAIRRGELPPGGRMPMLLVWAVVVVAVVLAIAVAVEVAS
jgi:putative membrane protein